ncbi:Serine/threonine protein kinase [Sporothrix epigloea]|uniref:Autophagy-related protein 1 n=1 Tax=Sporothrix epigloea TaxID=1892477 RepID=A0ABP0DJI3_9PEZI
MQNVLVPNGLPTPPASPLSFDYDKCAAQSFFEQQQHQALRSQQQQSCVPVAPADRIGMFLGSLQLTGIIGTGAYGVVYEAVDVKTRARYAVKALSKVAADGSPLDERQIEYQTREIRLHYMASAHPNVVSIHQIIDTYPDCLFVVLEYCAEGDLFYNITERGHFVGKDELARQVFCQLLDAVQYLHSNGIYHRDLKPENILVADNGETLKLADFGLATALERSEDYGCGSTFYMSPECLGQNSKRPYYYCAPNDVWSLGVILVNLTCGRNPWKQAAVDDSTYRAYVQNPKFLKTILPLSDELDDILSRIFASNPDQRITLPELKRRILACPRFTVSPQEQAQAQAQAQAAKSAATVVSSPEFATYDEAIADEDLFEDCAVYLDAAHEPLSPASSAQDSFCCSDLSDARTECLSPVSPYPVSVVADDEGADLYLTQDDLPEIMTPPPMHPLAQQQLAQQQQQLFAQTHQQPSPCMQSPSPLFYGADDAAMLGVDSPNSASYHLSHHPQHFIPQQQAPLPVYHNDYDTHLYTPAHYVMPPPNQQPLPTPPPRQPRQILLPLPSPRQAAPISASNGMPNTAASCSRFFPSVWDYFVGKNSAIQGHVQPLQHHLQQMHHMPALHQQMPMFMQGCY